jgi:hypothetical protein
MAGQIEKATLLAQQILNEQPDNAKMLCSYGDLTEDLSYYKKAWKVSGKRLARAQKALGYKYFYAN